MSVWLQVQSTTYAFAFCLLNINSCDLQFTTMILLVIKKKKKDRKSKGPSNMLFSLYCFVNMNRHLQTCTCMQPLIGLCWEIRTRCCNIQCTVQSLMYIKNEKVYSFMVLSQSVVRGSLYQRLSTICVSHGFVCPQLPIHRYWHLITNICGVVKSKTSISCFPVVILLKSRMYELRSTRL